MDIGQLRGLLLDLDCMTALRHTLRNRAMAALVDLCRACAKDNADEAALTAAYCRVYDAWLDAAAHGRGGFAREALEAVLFEESTAAMLCATEGFSAITRRMVQPPFSLRHGSRGERSSVRSACSHSRSVPWQRREGCPPALLSASASSGVPADYW